MDMTKDSITIREYVPSDKEAVLRLIRLNTPHYFAPEEEADLSRYLEKEREYYYVVLFGTEVVGCGGINMAEGGKRGKISWDIIHPDWQGRSLGSLLLKYRMGVIKSLGADRITVRTSQVAYLFYQKRGFMLKKVEKDYWAKGFDMYAMEYTENVVHLD
ncbi:GNAT family N-acetyltransferase [Bacteroides sp. K03]|uniref:GNAT family N-acetyltransferase n=1 Tax=Bacteroides sp. K03 TaxID=2718928 RepID=UPI001C8CD824|nr:GNAT family N-acetyltransferase [Bacteroides sp. K03]